MDDLPELALIRIFSWLPLPDQLNVRLVCKKWKFLIENDNLARPFSRSELILFIRMERRPMFWSQNQRPVNLANSLHVNPSIRTSKCFKNLFAGIKRLYIALTWFTQNGINSIIDSFLSLEHLEIENMLHSESKFDVDFSLPNLRTLYLGGDHRLVNLNCPHLTQLSVVADFPLEIDTSAFEKNLKFLKVKSFLHHPDHVLPSLEVLCFSCNFQIDLRPYRELKEVHFYYQQGVSYAASHVDLESLFRDRTLLERAVEVYYDGMPCKDVSELETYKCSAGGERDFLERYFLCPKKSDDLKFTYTKGRFYWRGTLLEERIDKLSFEQIEHLARSINWLRIFDRQLDYHHLFRYNENDHRFNLKLKSLFNYVPSLSLGLISQNLMDELPALVPNVISVYIFLDNEDERIAGRTNFSFLSKFKGLKRLSTVKHCISIDLIKQILENCKWFRRLIIKCTGKEEIQIEIDQEYSLSLPGFEFNFPSKSELFEHLEQNRIIKKHFFDEFFNESYFLDELTIADYFHDQSH